MEICEYIWHGVHATTPCPPLPTRKQPVSRPYGLIIGEWQQRKRQVSENNTNIRRLGFW